MAQRRPAAVKSPRLPVLDLSGEAANDADGGADSGRITGRVQFVGGSTPATMLIGTQRVLVADVERALTGLLALRTGGDGRGLANAAQEPTQLGASGGADEVGRGPGERAATSLDVGDVRPVASEDRREVLLTAPGVASGNLHPAADGGVGFGSVFVHVSDANFGSISGQAPPIDVVTGANVRARRKLLKMTQDDLARALNVHRSRVAQLEGGDAWALAQVEAVARILGCTLSDLVGSEPRIALTPDEWAAIQARRRGDIAGAVAALVGPPTGA